MRKFIVLLIGVFSGFMSAKAIHNRAGEITFRQISAYTYEFTITTFTYFVNPSVTPVDRDTVNMLWGDNTTSTAPRISHIDLPDYYRKNVYVVRHTFPGPGVYRVVMQDPTRNVGVINIPNSVRVFFSVETTLIVNPQIATNNTPVLLNYPLDKAAVGRRFVHNPGAFDADGDSLSYKLTVCTKELGRPIDNYSFPAYKSPNNVGKDTFYVDARSGDLVWNAPVDTGKYNIAMNIEEWRNGVKIGNIERDMQVDVHESKNHPPTNPTLPNICVVAGNKIDITFTVTDVDNDLIDVLMLGGPFTFSDTTKRARFAKIASGPGTTTVRFTWNTDFSQARKQPYDLVIKSTDNYPQLKLVDITSFLINVMSPTPKNLVVEAGNNSISLNWSKSPVSNVVGYEIYRSNGSLSLALDSCKITNPADYGYTLVGTTSDIKDTSFIDNKNLSPGNQYCYRVVAVLADGLRSNPSKETCTILIPGMPSLTSASVTKVDASLGEIFVSWVKPRLDTLKISAPGPYEYRIYRTDNLNGQNFSLINTIPTADLLDTTYTDKDINTIKFPYNYKVELYNNTPGNQFLISTPETASSLYPDLLGINKAVVIKFAKNDPWINTKYVIYRQNQQTLNFDSIGTTSSEVFVDSGLINKQKYTYRVKAYGYRILNGLQYNTLNWSHINSTTAIDTIKPKAPTLQVESACKDYVNLLTWNNISLTNKDEIAKYKVYYRPTLEGQMAQIAEVNNSSDVSFTYRHSPPVSLGGCYAVSAIDSSGNESALSVVQCVDSCSGYKLPNVFTPNDDGTFDVFVSTNPGNYVKKVDMKIYNRWGKLVFRTDDPAINWDGIDINTKRKVSSGVYYYICDVYEPRITGLEIRTLKDFVYVFDSPSNKKLE